MDRRWRGIYSLHTKSNRYTQLAKLGGTELINSVGPNDKLDRTDQAKLVTVRVFSGTDMQLGRTDMIRVRA